MMTQLKPHVTHYEDPKSNFYPASLKKKTTVNVILYRIVKVAFQQVNSLCSLRGATAKQIGYQHGLIQVIDHLIFTCTLSLPDHIWIPASFSAVDKTIRAYN